MHATVKAKNGSQDQLHASVLAGEQHGCGTVKKLVVGICTVLGARHMHVLQLALGQAVNKRPGVLTANYKVRLVGHFGHSGITGDFSQQGSRLTHMLGFKAEGARWSDCKFLGPRLLLDSGSSVMCSLDLASDPRWFLVVGAPVHCRLHPGLHQPNSSSTHTPLPPL